MSSAQRIAIVTGANKGIGYTIVEQLCTQFKGIVYLTSRNKELGLEALKKLNEKGLKPNYHSLDIDSDASIDAFRDYLLSKYGGFDVLVNNAAIAYYRTSKASLAEKAANTIKTNYFSTMNVCEKLFPLLNPHGRVVNVSSELGRLTYLPSDKLKAKFSVDSLTKNELNDLMNQYIEDCSNDVCLENGWTKSCYNMSKIGLNALTFIYQREFNSDPRPDLVINAVHPGYIATDLTQFKGTGTTEEGAQAPVYCALLPPKTKEPCGDFVWMDKTVRSWL